MTGGLLGALTVADVLALLAAVAVTRPSLLPRSAAGQLLAVTVAVLLAYLAGGVLRPVLVAAAPGSDLPPLLEPLAWAAAAGGVATYAAHPGLPGAPRLRPVAGVAQAVAVVGLADAGLQLLRAGDAAVDRAAGAAAAQAFRALVVLGVVLLTSAWVWRQVLQHRALALRYERDAPTALPFVGSVVGVLLLAGGARVAHEALSDRVARWEWVGEVADRVAHRGAVPADAADVADVLAATGMILPLLLLVALVVRVLQWWLLQTDLIPDARFAGVSRLLPTVSGYPGGPAAACAETGCQEEHPASRVDFSSMGRAGQEFVQTALSVAERAEMRRRAGGPGEPTGREPVRVYVGTRSGERRWLRLPALDARVDRALEDLITLGGLDRAYVLVVVPTGSGWVSPASVDALEYLTDGDCATIVLQYAAFPSWLALLLHRGRAVALHERLFTRLAETLPGCPEATGPPAAVEERSAAGGARRRVLVLGESLGALVGQSALRRVQVARGGGDRGKGDGGFADTAMWVGPPDLPRAVRGVRGTTPVLLTGTAGERLRRVDGARTVFLAHTDDPVARLGPSLLVVLPGPLSPPQPEPLSALPPEGPAGAAAAERLHPWWAGVTLARLLADVLAPSSTTRALPVAAGHDYGRELPRLVAAAVGRLDELDDAATEALLERRRRVDFGPLAVATTRSAPVSVQDADVTELRIHGVGGAPPQDTLNHPVAHQVAGDAVAGFYRCGTQEDTPVPADLRRREAYSWGGLTSGAWHRALWVLLLPFTVVNVSHWMALPDPGPGSGKSRFRRAAQTVTVAHRLLALALTAASTLTAIGVGMLAVGWECDGAGQCLGTRDRLQGPVVPGLGAPTLHFPTGPGWRAVVTVLPAVLGLAALWLLSSLSRNRYERWPPGAAESVPGARAAGLADPDFWRGRVPVERLQHLHTSVALALATAALAYPAYRALDGQPVAAALLVVLAAACVLLVGATVLTAASSVVGRPDHLSAPVPWRADAAVDSYGRVTVALQALTLLALGLLVVTVFLVGGSWHGPQSSTSGRQTFLPGYGRAILVAFWTQAALLLLLAGALAVARRPGSGTGRAGSGLPPGYTPVARGYAQLVACGLASLLAATLSAGVLLVTARVTGSGSVVRDRTLPLGVQQGAVAVVLGIAAFLAALGVLFLGRSLHAGRLRSEVQAEYGRGGGGLPADAPEQAWVAKRTARIARARATGWLVDRSWVPAAWALAGGAIGLVLSVAGTLTQALGLGRPFWDPWLPGLVDLSLALVGAVTAALLGYTYSSLRDRDRRRLLGVLWDTCTFWPRAAHPFAAPCYAERAVPDLVCRIEALARPCEGLGHRSAGVVVVGYSQGSLLAAAALAQLGARDVQGGSAARAGALERLGLVTCASPLRRIYARCFPAYFPLADLQLPLEDRAPEPVAATEADRRPVDGAVRVLRHLGDGGLWRNVYRHSDSVGSWVATPPVLEPPEHGRVDHPIPDPQSFVPPAGDLALPKIYAHGGYLADPLLVREVAAVTHTLRVALGLELSRPR